MRVPWKRDQRADQDGDTYLEPPIQYSNRRLITMEQHTIIQVGNPITHMQLAERMTNIPCYYCEGYYHFTISLSTGRKVAARVEEGYVQHVTYPLEGSSWPAGN